MVRWSMVYKTRFFRCSRLIIVVLPPARGNRIIPSRWNNRLTRWVPSVASVFPEHDVVHCLKMNDATEPAFPRRWKKGRGKKGKIIKKKIQFRSRSSSIFLRCRFPLFGIHASHGLNKLQLYVDRADVIGQNTRDPARVQCVRREISRSEKFMMQCNVMEWYVSLLG